MAGAMGMPRDRRVIWGLYAVVAFGLLLRIAAARGGLWLDEAWSMVMARDAATPLGVILQINHDNNHHLNSLWLQAIGMGAPPLLARAPAILCGTAAIWIAGRLGLRRSPLMGLVAASLFAISPALVTLGSEARGYAGMVLALLSAMLLIERWLARETRDDPALALALCFLLGTFSQLTMVFGLCAVSGWLLAELWRRHGLAQALTQTTRLILPSGVATIAVLAMVFAAARASPSGFQFGAQDAFTWASALDGLAELYGHMLGLPVFSIWLGLLPAILLLLAAAMHVRRLDFSCLAILAFPLVLGVLHPINAGHPRYYLLAGVALLLLIARLAAHGLCAGGWRRGLAGLSLAALLGIGLVQDARLVVNLRGDPAAAIAAMRVASPAGAAVLLDRSAGRAVLEVAAASAHYPLVILEPDDCTARPRFLFLERFGEGTLPAVSHRCGLRYHRIAQRRAIGLSGTHWALFAAERQADVPILP